MDNVSITPGLSDHDIVLAQVNAKQALDNKAGPLIPLYKKADWYQF